MKNELLAPNGKPSNLNAEQYKMVRTPAFKNWFGDWINKPNDNMLIDENGEPMIWWHTGGDWNELEEREGNGKLMFSPTNESMAYGNSGKDNITRPFFIKSDHIYTLPYQDRNKSPKFWKKNPRFKNPIYFVNAYGGFIIVTKSNQIKIADGRNKTFDSLNNDIRFDNGGSVTPFNEKNLEKSKKAIKKEINNIKFLECDGSTRVLHYALDNAGVKHTVKRGKVIGDEYVIPLHYWIELPDGNIVDYKSKMWLGEKAQEGLFKPKNNVSYIGESINLEVSKTLYDILTMEKGGSIAYHGSPILKEKMKLTPSKSGELGAGLYFTRDYNYAKNYSLPRGEIKNMFEAQKGAVAKLDLGKLKIKKISKEDYLKKRGSFYEAEQKINHGNWSLEIAKKAEQKLINYYENLGYDGLEMIDEPQGVIFTESLNKLKHDEDIFFSKGGRTIAQTPAPKKDQVYGSNSNKTNSSKNLSSAKFIKFDENTINAIKEKVKEHNQQHLDKKINLASAKAVVRRGMGAYSKSHRPNITDGKPNSRVAWGLARLNAFIYKIVNGKSKSGKYNQDDDLIEELGYTVSKYKNGGEMNQEIKCRNCGWEWNTKDSEEFDKYVCHKCGFDNQSFYSSDPINKMSDGGKVNKVINTPDYLKMFLGK